MASFWKIPWVRRQRVRLRRPVQIMLAPAVVNYIKLVINTSTIVADPPDFIDRARQLHPSIIALWHGQFFLLPGIYPRDIPARAIVARHDDAEARRAFFATLVSGLFVVLGAAGRKGGRDRGGAEGGSRADRIAQGGVQHRFDRRCTAPGPARKAGPGIIMISSRSGRPIVPFAGRDLPLLVCEISLEQHDHQLPFFKARDRHGRSALHTG